MVPTFVIPDGKPGMTRLEIRDPGGLHPVRLARAVHVCASPSSLISARIAARPGLRQG